MLLFVVLMYVYPLKFLFTLLFSGQIYGEGHSPFKMQARDFPKLMMIYGIGYNLIYLLFSFMYIHALKKGVELQLTAGEVFDTKTKLYKNIILIAIGLLSVFVSQIFPPEDAGIAGMVYILIGPALSIFYSYRTVRKRKVIALHILSQDSAG